MHWGRIRKASVGLQRWQNVNTNVTPQSVRGRGVEQTTDYLNLKANTIAQ